MNKVLRKSAIAATALLTLITGVFGVAPAMAALPNNVTVTVHYYRTAGDYNDWNVYLWKNKDTAGDVGLDGFAFTGTDDFGVFMTKQLTEMSTFKDVGFIIRKGAWVAKEGSNCGTGGDRFMTPDSNGVAEIWIKQGDCTIYTTAPVVTPPSPQIIQASFDDLRKITVNLNRRKDLSGLVNAGFELSGGLVIDRVESISGTLADTNGVYVYTTTDIPFGQTFTLTHTGTDAENTFGTKTVSIGSVMNSEGFNSAFTYTGDDLGFTYSASETAFRVWAPIATEVSLLTYDTATQDRDAPTSTMAMTASDKGTWAATVSGNLAGKFYLYKVVRNGQTVFATDPYARASAVNSGKSAVVDLDATDPEGWSIARPAFSGKNVDATVYELHVRDFSKDSSSGIPTAHRGKFLALADNLTSYSWSTTTVDPKTKKKVIKRYSTKTGVSAIKDLGVTHVQLLPVYDFASGGDETSPEFNWGYDPAQYNVPEGGYSTNPTNPAARITELKAGIRNLHANGLRVIMDVVYNHVASWDNFSMETITPGYMFRRDDAGNLLNGTGCGNEVASERSMVSKFIVDSVKYWATEYKMDGFRFDLMGILDVTTMQKVRAALTAIDPTIVVLGEGWNMGGLPEGDRAAQINIDKLDGIAAFNDQIRDGIKGSVFVAGDTGWATGNFGRANDVVSGITGNVAYSVVVSPNWITNEPGQSVNYVEAHDNLTLFDKLNASTYGSRLEKSALQRFAGSIVYLAQGMPFQQAGQEWERTKSGDDNSYSSGDAVNMLRYKQRVTYAPTYSYYKGLIALRKAHPAFRMSTTAQIKSNLSFISRSGSLIAYRLNGTGVRDSWKTIVVAHNAGKSTRTVSLPAKTTWYVVVKDDKAGTATLQTLRNVNTIAVPKQSTMVVYTK